MNQEKFDPHNPEYKKVEDLPQEQQAEFADVEGGFVRKEAIEEYRSAEAKTKQENSQRSFVDKSLGKNKMTSLDILHKAGLVENKEVLEKEQRKAEEFKQKIENLNELAENVEKGICELNNEKLRETLESIPSLLFIYRSNELFEKFLPNAVENIKSAGSKITEKVFPQGTDIKEIEAWYEEHSGELAGKIITTDRTCKLPEEISKDKNTIETLYDSLDSRFEKLTMEYMTALMSRVGKFGWKNSGIGYIGEGDAVEGTGRGMQELLKIAFENKERVPEKVYLVKERITDHWYEYDVGLKKVTPEFAVDTVKKWLTQGGVSEQSLVVVEKPEDIEKNSTGRAKDTWIVIDRHNSGSIKRLREYGENVKILQLPFADFAQDVIKNKLITPSDSQEFDFSKEMARKSISGALNGYADYIEKLS